jgi:hypothetical protein
LEVVSHFPLYCEPPLTEIAIAKIEMGIFEFKKVGHFGPQNLPQTRHSAVRSKAENRGIPRVSEEAVSTDKNGSAEPVFFIVLAYLVPAASSCSFWRAHARAGASPALAGGATAVHLAVQAFHFQPQAAIAGGVRRIAPLRNDPFEAGDR